MKTGIVHNFAGTRAMLDEDLLQLKQQHEDILELRSEAAREWMAQPKYWAIPAAGHFGPEYQRLDDLGVAIRKAIGVVSRAREALFLS